MATRLTLVIGENGTPSYETFPHGTRVDHLTQGTRTNYGALLADKAIEHLTGASDRAAQHAAAASIEATSLTPVPVVGSFDCDVTVQYS